MNIFTLIIHIKSGKTKRKENVRENKNKIKICGSLFFVCLGSLAKRFTFKEQEILTRANVVTSFFRY